MSALQKLKAYFGMVPADEDGYDDYRVRDGYPRDDLDDEFDGYAEPPARAPGRYHAHDGFDAPEPPSRGRVPAHGEPAVHGALAMERRPDPGARLRPVPEQPAPAQRDPLSKITTLHPTTNEDARSIGEHYREGTPVIMNLTEMENADAKRLVDFAAGLAFALRGSMDKVTNKVFLLSPPGVDVTAEDRRRIAEGGLFRRG